MNNRTTSAVSIEKHYKNHSSASYDSAYFYSSPGYIDHLTKRVHDHLQWTLKKNTSAIHDKKDTGRATQEFLLLDIGGGTGSFTKNLLREFPHHRAIVMDPFLEHHTAAINISFVKASATEFIIPENKVSSDISGGRAEWWTTNYQQVLIKEVVHHFDPAERRLIFNGIREGLVPSDSLHSDGAPSTPASSAPAILIITRPKYDIDYPIWPTARDKWSIEQPAVNEIMADLVEAGFSKVSHQVEAYPCAVDISKWKAMVQQRFWSTFASFTDEELKEACDTMEVRERHRIDQSGKIRFEDRLLFISAYV